MNCCYARYARFAATTIPLRVGEEWWIYTSTLRVSVYVYPPLFTSPSGDSCKLILHLENLLLTFFSANLEGKFFCPAENRWNSNEKEEDQQIQPNRKNIRPSVRNVEPREYFSLSYLCCYHWVVI